MAVDANGDLYIADYLNRRIRRVSADGAINTVAGNGLFKYAGENAPGASAAFNIPTGVAVDPSGNLYVADRDNHRIRKVSANGVVSTVAGNGLAGFSGDGGPAVQASLNTPLAVAAGADGSIYLADRINRRIRKVSADGTIATIAGDGFSGTTGDGGPATAARFRTPVAVAVDGASNIYVADQDSQRIRRIGPDGTIATAAGTGTQGFSGDGGPATSAALSNPAGVAADSARNFYIGDRANRRVRKVSATGVINTVAGNGSSGSSGDGGPATSATLRTPEHVAVDTAGNVYFADSDSYRIRRVAADGTISTVAGNGTPGFSGDGGLAVNASIRTPGGLAVDASGNLYIADKFNDRIRKVLAAAPAYSLAPANVSFSAAAGTPVVAPQLVAVTGAIAGLAWNASSSVPWLTVSPPAGVTPGLLSVGVNLAALDPGVYRATVMVQAPVAANPQQTVAVDLTVLPPSASRIELDRPAIVFQSSLSAGTPAVQTLRISNSGGGSLTWTARAETLNGGNWLRLSAASGAASTASPAVLQVNANVAGLAAGIYSGQIIIESPSSQPRTVAVDLLLSQATQAVSLSSTVLRFTAVEGEGTAERQRVAVVNTGQGTMNWQVKTQTVNGGNWLAVSPANGQSEAASVQTPQLDVGVDAKALRAGSYAGVIQVEAPGASNSPRLVTVTLTVLPAGSKTGTRLSPPGLIFAARAGGSSPSSQVVRLTTSNPTPVDARGQTFTFSGADWLQVLPTSLAVSASDPRTVVVQPFLGSLAPGEYRGTLTFQFDDGSPAQAVDVFFLVIGGAATAASASGVVAADCVPRKLFVADRSLGRNFVAQVGVASPLEVQVVDDCGSPVSDATLVATFSSGDPPVTLAGLRDGTYTGAWLPVTAGDRIGVTLRANSPSLPSVELLSQGQVQGTTNAALVFPGGIVNAASFAPGAALAPGSIVSVFGQNLAGATSGASTLPLPTTLAGATLQVGGQDAPLFFGSSGQINAQLPYDLPVSSRTQVVIKGTASVTAPETITIAPARPGIFSLSQNGKGQGAILDTQGRVVDNLAPAPAGTVVAVYCTGLGVTRPAAVSGQAAPSNPPALVTVPVTATVGGLAATVEFAGLAPGFVGLYEVNVKIPSGVSASTAVPLVLLQDSVPSNTVTLAVR